MNIALIRSRNDFRSILSRFLVFTLISGAFSGSTALAQNLPDLYTILFPGINSRLSTNQVFPGDMLTVQWSGYNNSVAGIPENPPPPQIFGPAYGPWQDAVMLTGTPTNRLLGTATFIGMLAPGGGYNLQGTFAVPYDIPPGVYGVQVYIDYLAGNTNGTVLEANERNNADQVSRALTVLPPLSFTGGIQVTGRAVYLHFGGSVTQQFRIQASPTINNPTWSDLGIFPSLRGTTQYVDNVTTNGASRFYRLISP